ncbi:hypothetical protein MPDQ_005436 [Monascus purpureus]|uniref:Uncharacterized protein n=1 Tax=Monascus purpureus TaxID=5098 RepID=A0A507R0Y2_MONPU|nr:hypothetical protein MPDQ_005436 [Monascus purpureus]BDD57823.1 hypothetical protein MAP00_003153 [Monascus purpureus]
MPASTTSSDTKESNTRESSSTDPTTESGQGSSVPDSLDHIQWDLPPATHPNGPEPWMQSDPLTQTDRSEDDMQFPYDPQEDYFPPECGGHSSIEDRVHGTELNGHGLVYLGDLTEERLREHDDTEGFTPMLSYSLSNMVTEGQE